MVTPLVFILSQWSCQDDRGTMTLILEHFWNRWRKEYLTELREHHLGKKISQSRKIIVGDVVESPDCFMLLFVCFLLFLLLSREYREEE